MRLPWGVHEEQSYGKSQILNAPHWYNEVEAIKKVGSILNNYFINSLLGWNF